MVNRKRSYTLHFLLMAVLTTVALAAVNYLAMQHRARLDLTADKRFTLSEGTQRLFEGLTEGVHVTYFVDEEPPPKRINLERDVRDKLQELAASSGGKLTWGVERITADDARDKAEDYEKRKVEKTIEALTSGTDERATLKGVQGYYSSVEIKYGLAEPVVINGVRNLVDKLDETSEHRVDTLEFDISFAVLKIRSQGSKAPLKKLVKFLPEPLVIRGNFSQQMPANNPKLAQVMADAMNELVVAGEGKVKFTQEQIPFNSLPLMGNRPAPYVMPTQEDTVDPADPNRKGAKFYCAFLEVEHKERYGIAYDFGPETTTTAVLDKFSKIVNEIIKTPTKLGFVLPPGSMNQPRQPGAPPQTPYTDAFNYIQGTFGYQTELVDLVGDKRIPRDLALLICFEPNRLTERELYEIDRYLAEGGNVVMLYQGWEARLQVFSARPPETVALTKTATEPHFDQWCKFYGFEFGQDLLVDKAGTLAPYRRTRQGNEVSLTNVPMAAVVKPGDINADSIYGRGISAMPLPLPVEIKLNEETLAASKLERQDVVSLKENIFRFIPANPAFPELPLQLNMANPAEVENDGAATPGKDIRMQRLADPALVVTSLRGNFASYWATGGRKVPAWAGATPDSDPLAGKEPPQLKAKPGSLLLCSSAGTLNIEYLWGYEYQQAVEVVIPKGCTFFKNMAETHIYGEDFVRLRVRTGVAPRITGEVSDGRRLWWLLVCIAGMPLLLAAIGVGRGLMRAKERQDYEAALGAGGKES